MSKKKNRENATVESPESPAVESESPSHSPNNAPELTPPPPNNSVMDEVQSFLARREELAQKLAEEIEATEQKLAELKRTAAMLFSEGNSLPPKEKKAKKAKTRVVSREENSVVEPPPAEEAA